jgi:hypothetical protein
MQSPHFPCNLVPLRPKYFPQHPILVRPQPKLKPLNMRDLVSHPYKTSKFIDLYILILIFLAIKLEDKKFCTKWYLAHEKTPITMSERASTNTHTQWLAGFNSVSQEAMHKIIN